MSKQESRISELKARLDLLVDRSTLPQAVSPCDQQRRREWGFAMLVLSVFILVAGLHLPVTDVVARGIFVFGALLYAGFGAWSIDQGNRRT